MRRLTLACKCSAVRMRPAACCSMICLRSAAQFLLASFLIVALTLLIPGSPLRRHLLADADATRDVILRDNELRIQASQAVLDAYKAQLSSPKPKPSSSNPRPLVEYGADVGLTVLTMSRGLHLVKPVTYRTHYLTQSVARLLTLLNDTSLTLTYRLAICNVDERPDEFTEAQELEVLVPTTKRFGAIVGEAGSSRRTKATRWEKLKHDYVYCLQDTLARGVRYAFLVEDDALAHDHLLHVLEHVLRTVVEAPKAPSVTYVKFFHPQRLLGYYSLEVERLSELLALSLTLGAALALGCSCRAPHRGQGDSAGSSDGGGDNRSTERRQLWLSWAWWTALVAVAALAVGRENLLELRRLSIQLYQVTPTPSCCTPAMLFTKQGGQEIIDHLLSVTCTSSQSTDFWIDEFRRQTGARALLVQPNLFTHIGLVSTLRDSEVNPLVVAR